MIKNHKIKTIIDFLGVAIGAVIAAFAIEEFLVPCTILDGGVIGIGIMINNLTGFPLSILTILFNLPFLIVGSQKIERMFIVKSGFGMVIFSIFVEVFSHLQNATDQYILAVSFGGVILGAGIGLVIRYGGCLDGTETIAIMLSKRFDFSVGQFVLVFNIIIFTIAGFIFGFERAMYSLLTYFITSKVLDIIESGIDETKAAMIITNDAKEIAERIYKEMGRTVTIMEGEGLVSGKKVVLYCVLTHFEIHDLKNIINDIDESAFIAISDVSEIIGNHIKQSGDLNVSKKKNAP